MFFNSVRKKKNGFWFSLKTSAPRQFLEQMKFGCIITESKAQSMAWKRPTSPVAKKFKSQPSAGKNMLTDFGIWKMRFWLISFQRVKQLTVRTVVMCYERH
jgi:hypothetical protein